MFCSVGIVYDRTGEQVPEPSIELYVNSDGGDLVASLALVDTMRQITSPVHTVCIGRCRSVAAAVLAAGEPGHRAVALSARVSILEPPCASFPTVPVVSNGVSHTLTCETVWKVNFRRPASSTRRRPRRT